MEPIKHTEVAKRHIKRIKNKVKNYELLFTSFLVSLVLLLVDVISTILSKGNYMIEFYVKSFLIIILFALFLSFYNKWKKNTKKLVITVETPDSKKVIVGSGNVRFRIGGETFLDKLKRFFKNI